MKDLDKLVEPLNLIYYEYDKKEGVFRLTTPLCHDHIFTELITITYALTKHNIRFLIDEEKSIVLGISDTFTAKIKRYVKSLFTAIRNSRMNIFILSDKKVKWAKNLPVFDIEPLPQQIDFSGYAALIFTSKNAISALNDIDPQWRRLPAYVIAPQTAKMVKELGGKLAFVGHKKQGDEFALELLEQLSNKKVLYVRGKKVVSDLVNILRSNHINCEEAIVYETVCKKHDHNVILPKGSTIIFSSPSTIACFFENYSWDESFKAVSIGKTTAKYFPENISPVIADTTSLESCVKTAIELNS
ncbi:MAG: uroporphyrinogen-III synthase [Helicobacteraceae bacterium]|jgi:uroporphyrinogen-III synthase|nr:uroporphyrinogen-III synthase [Helicobacteraceae bacterium]